MTDESQTCEYRVIEQPNTVEQEEQFYGTTTRSIALEPSTTQNMSSICDDLMRCLFWCYCLAADNTNSDCNCNCDGCCDCNGCDNCDCGGCDNCDCGGCDNCNCGGCDCGGCDCSGCDFGGCDC